MIHRLALTGLLMIGLVLSGCSSQSDTQTKVPADTAPAEKHTDNDGDVESPLSEQAGQGNREIEIEYQPTNVRYELDKNPMYLGGLGYRPSLTWEYHGQKGDTAAWFTYGPLGDDTRQASLTVHFVPEDEAPEYTEYFAYWLSLMDYSNLENPESAALRHDRQADGMTVHVQSLYGPYEPPPGQLGPDESSPLPRHRLVGIVVEAPEGLVLFELVGPDHTARVMIEQFMNMIFRLKKAPSQS
jgi:hypothetical protein